MHLNPDEVIAQGAAIQAALKARHSELRDVVVTDVCPYTLGVDTSKSLGHTRESGYFAPVIERNRSIPCSRVRAFTRHMINKQRLILKSTRVKAGWWLIIFSLRSCQ